jgi:tetratricopeptide (TPR) repeat protein
VRSLTKATRIGPRTRRSTGKVRFPPIADIRKGLSEHFHDFASADEAVTLLNAPLAACVDLTFKSRPPPKSDRQFDGLTGAQLDALGKLDEADRHFQIIWTEEVVVGPIAAPNRGRATTLRCGKQPDFRLHCYIVRVLFRHTHIMSQLMSAFHPLRTLALGRFVKPSTSLKAAPDSSRGAAMTGATDVFVSYKAEDRTRLLPLISALEAEGFTVWWDTHIGGGAHWRDDIQEHLDAAKCVIVAWSRRSVGPAGDFVRDEATRAWRRGAYLPVRIDTVNPPLGFGEVQAISLKGWKGDPSDPRFQALAETVRRRIAGQGIAHVRLPSDRPGISRRVVVAGGAGAIALAGGGLFLHRRAERDRIPPEVEALLVQAKQLDNQNTREGQNQAIGLYQRVVQIAPQYADGWGWLGYAYGALSHYRERPEALGYKAKAEAAGRHALELDPNSAFGELALSAAIPFVGHWADRDQHLARALALRPHEDEVLTLVAVLLQFVGRSTEAVPLYSRVKHKPFTPGEYYNFIRALWSAGRLAELDQAIGDAASLYPTQANIWFTRVDIAVYDGQTNAVSALVDDPQSRPTRVSDEFANSRIRIAHAVQSRDPAQAESIMAQAKTFARQAAGDAEDAIRVASALGRLDDAFMLAEAYYFGRGFIIPDHDSKGSSFSPEQRQTRFLFEPVTKPMRADPRFEPIVKELGLDRYWRESGHPPDYRHVAGL